MSGLPTAASASAPDGVPPVLPLPDLGTPAPLAADDGLTRVHVIALVTVAFVVAIGAELLSASDWRPDSQPSQLELVTDALIGLSFLLVGIVVWDSRPGMRVGLLMYATGLAFFIGNLSSSSVPVLHHLGIALPGLWLVGLGVLVLAYPGDRLDHRVDRVLAVVALAWVVLSGVGLVTQLDPTRCVPAICPANPFRVDVGVDLAPRSPPRRRLVACCGRSSACGSSSAGGMRHRRRGRRSRRCGRLPASWPSRRWARR